MKVIGVVDRALTVLVTVLLVCSFTVMFGLAVAQVLLREIIHATISWADLAARHLVIWVGFFGAFLASKGERHFHIGFLSRFLGPRVRQWSNLVSDLFAGLICGFLVVAGWTFVTVGLDPKAVLFLGIPQATAALIVPVGFALMTLQYVIRAIQSLAKAIHGKPEEDPALMPPGVT
jgi:TRAP-type C4-dicarboxylate transport system permease small subunit